MDNIGQLESVKIDITISKVSEPDKPVVVVSRYIPLPPSSFPYVYMYTTPFEDHLLENDRRIMKETIQNYINSTTKQQKENKEEWLSRVIKRNPHLHFLMERIRPLSKGPSFCKYENCSTTENPEVLSREQVIQLIHQFLKVNKYEFTMRVLAEETGIYYNGMFRYSETPILKRLLAMGIPDEKSITKLPMTKYHLHDDVEVQTAAFYTHLDTEYDPVEVKKNIWVELASKKDSQYNTFFQKHKETKQDELKGASLNKLIEFLTCDDYQENNYMETFLMTYRSFTTPDLLLEKLMDRFKVPENPYDFSISKDIWKQKRSIIILRTIQVMQKWITSFFHLDFSVNMIMTLTNFLDDISSTNQGAQKILKALTTAIQSKEKVESVNTAQIEKVVYPTVPKNIFSNTLQLTDIDEQEIAKQITLMEYVTYSQIRPIELLNCAWSNVKLKHRAVNLIKSTVRFNQVSNWVARMILLPESLKVRRANYQKALNICKYLLQLKNFNHLYALSSSLQTAPIHRLKFTSDGMEKDSLTQYNSALEIFSSERAYKNYRQTIKSVLAPAIPYFGIYLTDLTFIEDGNQNYIVHPNDPNKKQLINWNKRRMVYNVVAQLQQFQSTPYDIVPVKQIQDLIERTLDVPPPRENELFELSLQREPRGAKLSDLKE